MAQDRIPVGDSLLIAASMIQTEIKLDGHLNEPDWLIAVPCKYFITSEPREGLPAQFGTTVRVLFDKNNLYLGVECKDSLMHRGVRITNLLRDFDVEGTECFAVGFDAENRRDVATVFAVTPFGNLNDMEVYNYGFARNADWNTNFSAKTIRTDSGWIAEMQIPFKALRYKAGIHEHSKAGICMLRVARRDNEVSSFPAYQRQLPKFRMVQPAYLTGVNYPKPSLNLQMRPYALVEANREALSSAYLYKIKAGIDAKLAYKPNAVIDLSLNTDFAQTEADQELLNISRFSVFLPEKRQFFLESASTFHLGDQSSFIPFTSRAIGLDAYGIPQRLDFGVRYIWNGVNQRIGALMVQQRESDSTRSRAAQIGVLAYKYRFNNRMTVSGLGTFKTAFSGAPHDNSTNGTMSLDFKYVHQTLISGIVTSFSNNFKAQQSSGFAGTAFLQIDQKKYWLLLSSAILTSNYNPALGFLYGPNTIEHFIGADKNFWPQGKLNKYFRLINPGIELDYYFYADDYSPFTFQYRLIPLRWTSRHGAQFSYFQFITRDHVREPFTIYNSELSSGNYHSNFAWLNYTSDPSQHFNYKIETRFGKYYDGSLFKINPRLTWVFVPHFSVYAEWNYILLDKIGVNKIVERIHLITPGFTYSLNPKFHLSGFYQVRNLDRRSRIYVKLQWEFKPLSYLYIVLNEINDDLEHIRIDRNIVKLNYFYQF
ncbi:MAG: carbohydrate binding family 9 domain-containing protein [Saprospiraceae bacterium]|nr:carbohydrate binding family 9 domain-containing protein [Saprospiraceae bacterium]HMW39737.1 carbohydrate binding family 9 domain-containing protein [Saprospiraceae bacterium]HMX89046.1 carbohydrate binding family 9 domain-containing protein [Saprospiraceae bacterium]HMZ40681.1 carbohydrate binding family 9 domain-containing protein [Saprospiraceae bacterium]HNA63942.1 carbohydrate binding family 9 domain-containing protein [Saprospiraceae bacterium]